MGTLANRLDKLDNKFTVIEREVGKGMPIFVQDHECILI